MPLNNPTNVGFSQLSSTTVIRSTVAAPANITAAQVLVLANPDRKGLTLWNDSLGNVYVEFGSVAPTTTEYTVKIAPGGYYELPYLYTGQIQGLWDAAGGTGVLVREFA